MNAEVEKIEKRKIIRKALWKMRRDLIGIDAVCFLVIRVVDFGGGMFNVHILHSRVEVVSGAITYERISQTLPSDLNRKTSSLVQFECTGREYTKGVSSFVDWIELSLTNASKLQ